MDTSKILYDFFARKIGKGKEFSTKIAMARFLNLSESDAAKLYKFLKGADTQYRAIIDWYGLLGGRILLPEEHAPNDDSPTALIQPTDNISLSEAMGKIAQLKRDLDEKDRQLGELYQYKHRWEGLIEIKRTEETVRVQAQQQKSLLYSSDPSACAGREPEARERLGPGGISPPEHDDPVRG